MGKGRPSPLRLRKATAFGVAAPHQTPFLRRSPGGGAWRRGVVCACAAKRKGTRAAEGRPRGRAGSAVCVMPRVGIAAKAMAVQKTRSASAAYQRVLRGTHGRAGNEVAMRAIALAFCERPAGRRSAFDSGCIPTRSARISRARRKRDPACDVQLPSPAKAFRRAESAAGGRVRRFSVASAVARRRQGLKHSGAAAKQQSAALCRIAEGGASDFKCPFRRSRRFAVRRARR